MDALDRAGCLVVTGLFDHGTHESVKGELASHMATSVAHDPRRTMGVYRMHRALALASARTKLVDGHDGC